MSLAENKARKLAERALARVARVTGTRGAESKVYIEHQRSGNTRFAVNEITSSGDVETATVTVEVSFGQRSASASTNQLDDRAIDEVIARAAGMARLAPENPERMPLLGRQRYDEARGASDAATAGFSPAGRARAAGAAIARARAGKVTVAGFYEHWVTSQTHASSAGLWAHHELTGCEYTCSARTADGTGSGWAGAASNRVVDLDADSLTAVAVDKATRSARPRRLDAGRYVVVLEPTAVAALIANLAWSLDARQADEGRSFFSKAGGATKVGETLFPSFVTFASDPGDVALGVAPFDSEGHPLRATRWIDQGKVTGLVYTRYWAKQRGKQSTGWPSGWSLAGGKATRDELIKGVKRGVLITRLWYLRWLDPQSMLITGLSRDGTFLIENGEIVAPVNNFRFNESPAKMLASCDGLSAPVVVGSKDGPIMRVPALRTGDFNLASISEAV
jgi:predicted Zn-dependent protease